MTVLSHLRSTHWQQSIQQWPTICTAPTTGRYAAVAFRNHWGAEENVLTIFLILQEHDLDFNDRGIMVLGCGPYHIGVWASFYSSASSLYLKRFPLYSFSLLVTLNPSVLSSIRQQCGVWLVRCLQHPSFETNGQEDGGGQPQPRDGQHRLRWVRSPLLWGADVGTYPGHLPTGGEHIEECQHGSGGEKDRSWDSFTLVMLSGGKLDLNIEFPRSKVLISMQYVQEEMIIDSDEVNNIFNIMCMYALAAWLGLLLEGKRKTMKCGDDYLPNIWSMLHICDQLIYKTAAFQHTTCHVFLSACVWFLTNDHWLSPPAIVIH